MTPISPGTVLAGRFRLEDLLEEAGGARFWRATDLTLMRDVAVHVVDESDPRSRALLDAARTSAAVSGAHLLRVLDAAVEDGVAYVVNEWGNGISLDKMLLEGPLPPRQAAWMVREVADAIADAHRQGVAHARLLPESVLINENGSVKLIGFVVDGALHGRPDTSMSDQESDVHNLASLLYAAVTGRWPGTPGTTIPPAPRDHGRVLAPRQVRAGVPRQLDRLCDSVLNHDEAAVPIRSAHEIRAALADYLGEVGEGLALDRPTTETTDPTERLLVPVEPGQSGDPQATQAALPVFDDAPVTEETGLPVPDDEPTQVAPRPRVPPVPPVPPGQAARPVPPVQPVQPSTRTPYVGMGSGTAPPSWGPDAQGAPEIAEPPVWDGGGPGSPWLRLAGLVAGILALLLAVVFAFNLGRGGSGEPDDDPGSPPSQSPRAAPVQLAAVDDFDPFGEPQEENPDDVPAAHDGDPRTAWTTSTYNDGPDITVYKPGVGLLVDLGSDQEVGSVRLTLAGSPSHVQLLSATGEQPPTSPDGLEPIAEAPAAGTSVDLVPEAPVTARWLVVWFTGLPQVSGGYRGGVAEIVVRS